MVEVVANTRPSNAKREREVGEVAAHPSNAKRERQVNAMFPMAELHRTRDANERWWLAPSTNPSNA